MVSVGRRVWSLAQGYVAAIGSVAIVTGLIGILIGRLELANVSMLYLIAVLATAVAFGSGPAVLASFAAFLASDWFFVEPYYTITVANPDEWTSLIIFLLTAIVTGQLAASQRHEAQAARAREREALVLYDVIRLMQAPNLTRALQAVVEHLRDELRLSSVAVELPGQDDIVSPITAGQESERGHIHAIGISAPRGWHGTLVLARRPGDPPFAPSDYRLFSAIATQLGLALERADLRRQATDAEVLRRTDELRKALLNAVSHDLRTPLASIIAAGGSLAEDDVEWTREDLKAFGRDVEQEALRLNRIVGNLLDLSRIQSGTLVPQKGWYDLGALIDDVVGRLRPESTGHRITIRVGGDLAPVYLDYVEIDQVLTNLIENAVKYTPSGTPIEVDVRPDGDEVRIAVRDRGPGVPRAELERIFEPFYRVGESTERKGSGLGLAVARGLIEAHGGHIWATNRRGGGACFSFTLPARDSDETRVTPTPEMARR